MQSYVLLPKAVKEPYILTQLAQYQHRQNKQIGNIAFRALTNTGAIRSVAGTSVR